VWDNWSRLCIAPSQALSMLCQLQVLGFHAEMPEGLPVMEIQNLAKS